MDYDSEGYFEALSRHVLAMSHCAGCGKWFGYPRAICPRCWSDDVSLKPVSGGGTVYSYQLRDTARGPGTCMGTIQLDEDADMMIIAELAYAGPAIGDRVEVAWEGEGGDSLAIFRKAQA